MEPSEGARPYTICLERKLSSSDTWCWQKQKQALRRLDASSYTLTELGNDSLGRRMLAFSLLTLVTCLKFSKEVRNLT